MSQGRWSAGPGSCVVVVVPSGLVCSWHVAKPTSGVQGDVARGTSWACRLRDGWWDVVMFLSHVGVDPHASAVTVTVDRRASPVRGRTDTGTRRRAEEARKTGTGHRTTGNQRTEKTAAARGSHLATWEPGTWPGGQWAGGGPGDGPRVASDERGRRATANKLRLSV